MQRYTILVTNDDGHDSPILPFFLDALAAKPWCGELRAVIPAREQSWIATAVSRFDALSVHSGMIGAHKALFVTGTPADCASLGVYNLFPDKPDFVFSGINMGLNAGLAFFLSSGTIGGAIEGFLSQVPSLALSVEVSRELFQLWHQRQWAELEALRDDWRRIAEAAVEVCGEMTLAHPWENADILSVNLPWGVHSDTPRVLTYLEQTRFKPLFIRDGEKFIHRMQGLFHVPAETPPPNPKAAALEGDMTVLGRGDISISPIHYGGMTQRF